ncbi:MAG TPA: fluoride efflux transporter CrcB [Gaiellaceae bacterium]|nr:fluoride efflux transporter CrcB [Gaiellaceae bacterium]
MPIVLAVAAGGGLGALARYGVDALIEHHADALFPWSTFTINVSGCFLNGLLVALVVDSLGAPQWLSRGLVVGFLGAYTTFSTFGAETYELTEMGRWGLAIANVALSAAAGVAAVALGQALGRA